MQDIEEFLKTKASEIDERIEKYLPRVFTKEYLEWAYGKARYDYDEKALENALSRPVWDFLDRGGKRWRPAMFLLIADAMGGDLDRLMDFVVVLELAHNGSIMVDDIEDMGEMRRGKPCTHKLFGIDVAVNAGNYMYFLPYLVLLKNRDKFESNVLLKAYEALSKELITIHLGQGTDIWWHQGHSDSVTEEQYLQMCAMKTGTLARLSARLAAILSGGTEEQVEKIGKMAEAVGVGFQIQDDVLSASGDRFQKGKGFGDDITEGKRTLLVIHTLRKADPEDRKRLLEILNMHTTDEKLIEEALVILKKYGAIEYAMEKARSMVSSAWNDVKNLLPESDAKTRLESFIGFLVNREI